MPAILALIGIVIGGFIVIRIFHVDNVNIDLRGSPKTEVVRQGDCVLVIDKETGRTVNRECESQPAPAPATSYTSQPNYGIATEQHPFTGGVSQFRCLIENGRVVRRFPEGDSVSGNAWCKERK